MANPMTVSVCDGKKETAVFTRGNFVVEFTRTIQTVNDKVKNVWVLSQIKVGVGETFKQRTFDVQEDNPDRKLMEVAWVLENIGQLEWVIEFWKLLN